MHVFEIIIDHESDIEGDEGHEVVVPAHIKHPDELLETSQKLEATLCAPWVLLESWTSFHAILLLSSWTSWPAC